MRHDCFVNRAEVDAATFWYGLLWAQHALKRDRSEAPRYAASTNFWHSMGLWVGRKLILVLIALDAPRLLRHEISGVGSVFQATAFQPDLNS